MKWLGRTAMYALVGFVVGVVVLQQRKAEMLRNLPPPPVITWHNVSASPVEIGDFTYHVRAWAWADLLPNLVPRSRFLMVDLTELNSSGSMEFAEIPNLIDNTGAVHSLSYYGDGDLRGDVRLNPGLSASGILIYDVPADREYAVLLTDGSLFDAKRWVVQLKPEHKPLIN